MFSAGTERRLFTNVKQTALNIKKVMTANHYLLVINMDDYKRNKVNKQKCP
jgi:hypothetical protein